MALSLVQQARETKKWLDLLIDGHAASDTMSDLLIEKAHDLAIQTMYIDPGMEDERYDDIAKMTMRILANACEGVELSLLKHGLAVYEDHPEWWEEKDHLSWSLWVDEALPESNEKSRRSKITSAIPEVLFRLKHYPLLLASGERIDHNLFLQPGKGTIPGEISGRIRSLDLNTADGKLAYEQLIVWAISLPREELRERMRAQRNPRSTATEGIEAVKRQYNEVDGNQPNSVTEFIVKCRDERQAIWVERWLSQRCQVLFG